jgi:riboflavin biosynthesis pyrimidine reductase
MEMSKSKKQKLELKWSVGVALDTSANDVPIFVGRGTNTDPEGNLVDGGFSFDVMFTKEHPLTKKMEELEQKGCAIRLIIVPCENEKASLETAARLIKQYGLVKDGGTLLNWSLDGEGEGRTYSGSPSKMLH